ncbi:glycosyl transferase family 2 [Flavobacterium faecale]|uniref:Glycosyl transferase family 2 n=1 Tax=Flavobacterium faecale TaxID=1355330 RepID=A0A2S1LD38_9FLAO|nr:glycosyltransferase family 2 protein [Flavobacterium faecale]AWG21456.1 glycosyl transferase family 2 [Flavobacterium faecale]
MISVVIRNKNQAPALSFLLKVLTERYSSSINEIIVIDNCSVDDSEKVAKNFGARWVTIKEFSYGASANLAAQEAVGPVVVIFSAHSYPVSHDFFGLIQQKFDSNPNLAGLRCLHSSNDYRNYSNGITAKMDPNKSGLIFSGSAFNKKVWEQHPFRNDVATFEDKEWSKRVLEKGYDIEFVPSIFHYEITRTAKQNFFRYKNDVVGNYQLWHHDVSFGQAVRGFFGSTFTSLNNFVIELCYHLKRFLFLIKFINNKPEKF